MQATIVSVSQSFSFETGASTGVLTLKLPDGKLVQARIHDAEMQHLLGLHVAMGGQVQPDDTAPPARVPGSDALRVAQPAAAPARAQEEPREYAPMSLDDAESPEFGGDFSESDLEPGGPLAEIAQNFAQAQSHVIGAVGERPALGKRELAQVAGALSTPMPVPKFAAHVGTDDMGNPVRSGPGVVDHQTVTGGDLTGEEDAGSI